MVGGHGLTDIDHYRLAVLHEDVVLTQVSVDQVGLLPTVYDE